MIYRAVLFCVVLCCIELYCTVVYGIDLHCTVLCYNIPTPDKDSFLGTSYRLISLLYPYEKCMEALILTTFKTHLSPADDQHGFRPGHSTTFALLQMTRDGATCFNQRKPPHRTICVAVDITAEFDNVNHNELLSTIVRSRLPVATCWWLSNYIRGS